MTLPIIATKLYIAPPRPTLVLRPHLRERLDQGMQQSLTLVSAPAGFGKTTLVSEWIATCERPAAWFSIDITDNDLSQFLVYFVAALQTIDPALAAMLAMLQAPQPLPTERVLTALINAIAQITQPFVLVLDDYHHIDNRAIHEALAFLLDHMPPSMHLVIASRVDPPLPLARLRARRRLTELRAADLRFTPDEAAIFLNQIMGLRLSAADVVALETRTEGWIVGLHMAALSLQGRSDTASFIRAFTGSHRFVIDYLVEEVIQHQPEAVRHFLLHTSMLERLYGPLCDAVTGGTDSAAMLETLERANLFLIPLDDQRQWYRYHHLFADMLQARLRKAEPEAVATGHQQASAWYEQQGQLAEAVRHALTASDWPRSARLIEIAWPALRRSRQEATVLAWIKALPETMFQHRPVLSAVAAWALLDAGELDAAEARLRETEHWLAQPNVIVFDQAQFRSLPAAIANARAYRAQALGDMPATIAYTRQAIDLLPEDDFYERGTTTALLGLAFWANGQLDAGFASFANGLELLERGGGIVIRIGGTTVLAAIAIAGGHLLQSQQLYEQALQVAHLPDGTPLPGTAELHLGLAEICYERGDMAAARACFAQGRALGEAASLPGYEHLWCLIPALLCEAEGDLAGAARLLAEAEQAYYRSPIPNTRPIPAMQAQVLAAQGKHAEALAWARARGLSADDAPSYLREYEHLTLARLLIASFQHDHVLQSIRDAARLLERLLAAAEAEQRNGSVLAILVLLAITHELRGERAAALLVLERALRLAEPEAAVRVFTREGATMQHLLREAANRRILPAFVQTLLASFTPEQAVIQQPPESLDEPLSQREHTVLRLLATELSGPEIAEHLVIGLSTVRTYTKSIYRKLGVNNRIAAIKRAGELGLL